MGQLPQASFSNVKSLYDQRPLNSALPESFGMVLAVQLTVIGVAFTQGGAGVFGRNRNASNHGLFKPASKHDGAACSCLLSLQAHSRRAGISPQPHVMGHSGVVSKSSQHRFDRASLHAYLLSRLPRASPGESTRTFQVEESRSPDFLSRLRGRG